MCTDVRIQITLPLGCCLYTKFPPEGLNLLTISLFACEVHNAHGPIRDTLAIEMSVVWLCMTIIIPNADRQVGLTIARVWSCIGHLLLSSMCEYKSGGILLLFYAYEKDALITREVG